MELTATGKVSSKGWPPKTGDNLSTMARQTAERKAQKKKASDAKFAAIEKQQNNSHQNSKDVISKSMGSISKCIGFP